MGGASGRMQGMGKRTIYWFGYLNAESTALFVFLIEKARRLTTQCLQVE